MQTKLTEKTNAICANAAALTQLLDSCAIGKKKRLELDRILEEVECDASMIWAALDDITDGIIPADFNDQDIVPFQNLSEFRRLELIVEDEDEFEDEPPLDAS